MTIEAKLDRIIELIEKALTVPAVPTEAAPAKKARAAKAAVAAEAPAAPAAVPAQATPATGTCTLDDVRVALVALASRTGSRDKSNAILAEFGAKVTGDLKAEDFAKVVSKCQSAG